MGVRYCKSARCAAPRNETQLMTNKYQFSVDVVSQYLPEQSEPDKNNYAFAYTVTITNTGQIPAQLISRHWIITDSDNQVREVKGLGVVGHQPLLQPGQKFEYTSGTPLATPVGTMKGSFQIVAEDGTPFDAPVAEFALAIPRTLH